MGARGAVVDNVSRTVIAAEDSTRETAVDEDLSEEIFPERGLSRRRVKRISLGSGEPFRLSPSEKIEFF